MLAQNMMILVKARRVDVAGRNVGKLPTLAALEDALDSSATRKLQKIGEFAGVPFDRTKSLFDDHGLSAISECDSGKLLALIATFNRRDRCAEMRKEEPQTLFFGSIRLGEFTLAPHISYSAYERLVDIPFDCPSVHVCPGDRGDIATVSIGFEETPWG